MAEESRRTGEPVVTPLSRAGVPLPHRYHRWLTLPSGWVLAVCLFLPSVKLCETSDPIPMAMLPPVWPVYLVGLVIALAGSALPEQLRARGLLLFTVVRATAIGAVCLVIANLWEGELGPEAAFPLAIAVLVFAATWRDTTELAVGAVGLVASLGSFAFTLAVALERLAVWGAYVGVTAAGGLVVGTLWWCAEAAWARRRSRAP